MRPARTPFHAVTTAALAVLTATMISGCSSPTDPASECLDGDLPEAPGPLVLVVGVHAGTPAPALPASAVDDLQAAVAAGHPVRLITVDGTPEMVPLPTTGTIPTGNCDAFTTGLAAAANATIATIERAEADSDGNQLYAGLGLAADIVHAGQWKDATILVIDSGLTERTTSPVNFALPGMTTLTHDEVTDAATFATTHQPLDLDGMNVQFHGLGATAPPQPALSPAEKQTVATLWKTIATQAGATVTMVPTPRTGPGPDTRYITRIVPTNAGPSFTPPTHDQPTRTTFSDTDIHFATNSAHLTDPDAATAALTPLATWLATDPGHHTTLRGRTDSTGASAHNLDLADRRAATVKNTLLGINPAIDPNQVTTIADGETFPGALTDTRPDGTLNPKAAAANRHVLAISTTK